MKLHQTLVAIAALCGTVSAHALTLPDFDAANDFSIAQNPNGVWSYGYETGLGQTFNAFTAFGSVNGMEAWFTPTGPYLTPLVYHNNSGSLVSVATTEVAAQDAGFHPGQNTLAIYRFTAPSTRTYSVEALFFTQDANATGVDVYVLKNNGPTPLFQDKVAYGGADTSVFWSGTVSLSAGQTLEFAVGNAGNYANDSTGIGVQINAVPEPQTYALMGAGLALVGWAARRRKATAVR